ncbi:MAG: lipocalin family protein [Chitinophagales bacterium]|nr:lipocalin family protein [Chitinophagales bacterium]
MNLTGKILTLLCGIALFAACTKSETDKEPDPASSSTSTDNLSAVGKLLVAGKWQLTASTATAQYNGKDTTADLYADMDDCEKDDFIQFAADGTVTRDENTNKCTGHPQSATMTWKLMDNDTRIAIYDNNPDTMGLEVTTAQMKFTLTQPNSSNVPVTYVDIYKNIK